MSNRSQVWWNTLGILVHRRLGKENPEFKTSLGYTVKHCLMLREHTHTEIYPQRHTVQDQPGVYSKTLF